MNCDHFAEKSSRITFTTSNARREEKKNLFFFLSYSFICLRRGRCLGKYKAPGEGVYCKSFIGTRLIDDLKCANAKIIIPYKLYRNHDHDDILGEGIHRSTSAFLNKTILAYISLTLGMLTFFS